MADEDYEMDGGYEDEPMDPEFDEGEEVEEDNNNNEDAPDPIAGEGEGNEKVEQEPIERPRNPSLWLVPLILTSFEDIGKMGTRDFPSQDAIQISNNITNLYISTDIKARGEVVGEDGVRVHSLILPGFPSSTTVYFSMPGEVRFRFPDIGQTNDRKRFSYSIVVLTIYVAALLLMKWDTVNAKIGLQHQT